MESLVKLTDISIRALKPAADQRTYFDDTLKGFGVRVSPGGTKSYVLLHGDKRKRVTIGRVGIVKLADAREKAKDLLAHHQLNGDKPPSLTFGEAKKKYCTLHLDKNNKASTAKETKRLLSHFASLDDDELSDLTASHITTITDKLSDTPSSANHHFVAVKSFLNWCVERDYLARNPLIGAKKPSRTVSRDRVLSDDELKKILKGAPLSASYGQIVLWCLYTLQRRGQIAQLRWEFFNFKDQTIKWPPEAMKGNRSHEIPYTFDEQPDGLLFPNGEGNVWNAWSKPHKAFLKLTKTDGWSLHDLRRTGATIMAGKLSISPHIIERILAHASGTLTPLALIYNRATYLDEMREALKNYKNYLDKLK